MLKQIEIVQHKNKFLYKYQFKDDEEPDIPAKLKWSNELQNETLNWKLIYNNAFVSTIMLNLETFSINIFLE